MNKKGDAEILLEFATIIIVVMLLLSFWYFFFLAPQEKTKQSIKELEFKLQQERLTILNLLKTDAEFDLNGDNILDKGNMADLLVFSYTNNNFDKFSESTKEKLGLLFKDTKANWNIKVFDENEKLIWSNNNFVPFFYSETSIIIPINNQDYLKVVYSDDLIYDINIRGNGNG